LADAGQGTGEEGEAGRLEQRLERGAQLGWREACVVPHQWLVLGGALLEEAKPHTLWRPRNKSQRVPGDR